MVRLNGLANTLRGKQVEGDSEGQLSGKMCS